MSLISQNQGEESEKSSSENSSDESDIVEVIKPQQLIQTA
jgi:hypothetical protein